jgi:hypothetical protein
MSAAGSRSTSFDIGLVIMAPSKDPKWLTTCGLMGLLSMIPIAGALNLMGWMRAIAERRIRGGDDADTLPPAGLAYMSGGWRMLLCRLPLVALLMFFIIGGFGVGVALLMAKFETLGSAVMMLTYLAILAMSFTISVLSPAIDFLHIVDNESWASVAFGRQWETVRAGGVGYVLAFVANLVGGMIAQLGLAACFVGIFVTVPYSVAIQAAVLAEYARVLAARPVDGSLPAVRVGGVGGQGGSPFGIGSA